MILVAVYIPFLLILIAAILLLINSQHEPHKRLINQGFAFANELAKKKPDKTNVKSRLIKIESEITYERFRLNQILISTAAFLMPILLSIIGIFPLFTAFSLSILISTGLYIYLDRDLTKQVERRRQQMESEFPAIVEILTLAIGAGDTPLNAFSRIAYRSNSILAKSMRHVVTQVKLGMPFHKALDLFSKDSDSLIVRRFVDALVIAMTRGAPLVDVLHRHVSEARINHRNLVLDKSGKAEITMMIPIIFLILPISVIFALWPSMSSLNYFAG